MNPRVLRRFVILLGLLTAVAVIGSDLLQGMLDRPPGDYETEVGGLRLQDGLYDEALKYFDQALVAAPDHRGALMGRALVYIQSGQPELAIAELDYLIAYLQRTLEPEDRTGRGVLAAAFANRGIVYDRMGDYQQAFDNYISALRTDEDTVSGPGVVDKILYGSDDISTVRKRARYIYEQLQLPPDQRRMRMPEIDDIQRMYKP